MARTRRRPPGRPRRGRCRGVPAGQAASSTRATSCSSSPRARAAPTARSRRPATASPSSPCAPARRSCRSASRGSNGVWPRGQKLPHPGGRVTVRVGRAVPPRRRAAARHGPRDRQGPRDRRSSCGASRSSCRRASGASTGARAAEAAPARSTGGRTGTPCDNRRHGNRRRTSASPSAPASATAFARRSTRPRSRRPPASRRTPSARSSTTTASSASSRTWASRPSTALDDVDHGAAVVIRAHGVRPDVLERAEARGLEVIDGTCTWVIAEQRELRKLVDEGYTIVLLGTPNHPEVVGLLGFAPDVIVVDEEDEWDAAIPRRKKLALISQSTQPPWKFEKLAALMVSRSHELKIVNTVCPVTIRRQEDTIELAREVDLMVVVGGRSSANTKELTRLCEIVGTPAIQIQGVADLTDADRSSRRARRRRDRRHVHPDRGPARRSRAGSRERRHARRRGRCRGPRRRRAAPGPPRRPAGPPRSRHLARASPRPALPDPWPAARTGSRSSPSSAGRTSARARSSIGSSAGARPSSRTARTTTRDRLYGDAEWNGRRFVIVDTGGLELDPDDPIEARGPGAGAPRHRRGRRHRLRGRCRRPGMTARTARPRTSCARAKAPVIVAVNKADNEKRELEGAEFHALGWDETYAISAAHGRGTGDLLDAIVWALPPESERERARKAREAEAEAWADEVAAGRLEPYRRRRRGRRGRRRRRRGRRGARHRPRRRRPRGREAGTPRWPPRTTEPAAIAFVGRPERRQVEPAQRAARRGALDRVARSRARPATPSTPGWRGAAARSSSSTRPASGGAARSPSGPAAEKLLDAARPAGAVAGRRRGPRHRCRRGPDRAGRARRGLRGRGGQGPGHRGQQVGPPDREDGPHLRPVRRVDPQRGPVPRLRADHLDQRQDRAARRSRARGRRRHLGRAPPPDLDRASSTACCCAATERTPPPPVRGRRPKLFYATQAAVAPPTFVFFASDASAVHFSYRRYLENRLRETFGFDGTPIKLVFRDRTSVKLPRRKKAVARRCEARPARTAAKTKTRRLADGRPASVAVVGAGAWGTTLARLVARRGAGHAPVPLPGDGGTDPRRPAATRRACRAWTCRATVIATADPAALADGDGPRDLRGAVGAPAGDDRGVRAVPGRDRRTWCRSSRASSAARCCG